MFLENIISGKRNLFWIIFHALLGIISTVTPFALIFWFYFIIITNFNKAIFQLRKGKSFFYIALVSYTISFEMLSRMSKCYPFIPMEISKYLIPIFSVIGVISGVKKGNYLWLTMGIFISFGLLFDYSGERQFSDIINNYFGVLAIFLGLFFLSKQNISHEFLDITLKLILFGVFPVLIYCYIKIPQIEDITFMLSANFQTSAGAATNQVSTILGLGLFLSFYLLYKRIPFSGFRIIDVLICIAFLTQGLLTFSRGGIVVAIICIVILIFKNTKYFNFRNLLFSGIALLAVFVVFNYLDNLTGGKLLLRYQGETEGTYTTGIEKDLNKITSGRSLIFEEDMNLWFKHPIFGVGVGASRYIRRGNLESTLISSHIELSRLLAEHGIFGLVFFIFLINLGIKLWRNIKNDSWCVILFLMYLIALLTSFHSAMRTFVTPLLLALSSIGMYNVKKN